MTKERPQLNNLLKDNMSKEEVFQNKTLRPIIKMQHHLLIASFQNYIFNKKIKFIELSNEKKIEKIKEILLRDNTYKNLINDLSELDFSLNEFDIYNQNSSEYKRRILKIITQRLQDSLSEIAV